MWGVFVLAPSPPPASLGSLIYVGAVWLFLVSHTMLLLWCALRMLKQNGGEEWLVLVSFIWVSVFMLEFPFLLPQLGFLVRLVHGSPAFLSCVYWFSKRRVTGVYLRGAFFVRAVDRKLLLSCYNWNGNVELPYDDILLFLVICPPPPPWHSEWICICGIWTKQQNPPYLFIHLSGRPFWNLPSTEMTSQLLLFFRVWSCDVHKLSRHITYHWN